MLGASRILALWLVCGCGRLGFAVGAGDDDEGGHDAGGTTITKFSRVDAAGEQACAIYRDRGYCWGANDRGQLGVGDTADRAAPTEVALPAGVVTRIDAGTTHGCAIVAGEAWCWGSGALGDGSSSSTVPVRVTGLPPPVTEISAAYNFTCAIASGDVYCWGDDSEGRLGNGAAGSSPLPGLTLAGPAQHVFGGGDHACAVTTDGTGWCWGHNDGPGALGQGTTVNNTEVPGPVVDLGAFTAITMGGHAACGVNAGTAWCWGTGASGELGNGLTTSSTRPVAAQLGAGVTAIHTGGGPISDDATCVVRNQALWCWGGGDYGRLGNRTTQNLAAPVEVAGLGGPVFAAAVGWVHTCALVEDGEAWCWGQGDRGELGDGTNTTSYDPVRVVLPTIVD